MNWNDDSRIQEIKQYCKDKSIILVGNARINKKLAHIIDQHNIVVRMNFGFPGNDNIHRGKKTDIWFCAFKNKNCQMREYLKYDPKPKYIIRLNDDYINEELKDKFIQWDIRRYYKLRKEMLGEIAHKKFHNLKTGKKHISCGIRAIYFFIEFLKLPIISIVGYDFFNKNNFYESHEGEHRIGKKFHEPEIEKQYVYKLKNLKKVNIYDN